MTSTRRRAGARELNEGELQGEVQEWAAVCGSIPEADLEPAYFRALRERTVRAAMQPGELFQVWQRMREANTHSFRPSKPIPEGACRYCENTGWQTLLIPGESGALNSHARACACSCAPLSMRSEFPFREPHWLRDVYGRWTKAN